MELRLTLLAMGCAVGLAPITGTAQTPSFTLVGSASGTFGSVVRAVSADGSAAAGYSVAVNGSPGFTWTAQAGRTDFGRLPGMPTTTQPFGVSGDGSTVVGSITGAHAFRRVGTSSTIEDLGVVTGYTRSAAFGTSGNGSVVVGRSETGLSGTFAQAFRWSSATGMQGLGFTQADGVYSESTGISRDGNTIIGNSMDDGGFNDAFLWRDGSFSVLPQLPGTRLGESWASGTNTDGSIVVGRSGSPMRAAMWRNGTAIDLALPLGWTNTEAVAVCDDGSVIVGSGQPPQGLGNLPVLWTPLGLEPLSTFLEANGVTIPTGWSLTGCYGVSADGRTFVGLANPASGSGQGFVATIPEPASLLLGGAFLLFLQRDRRRTDALNC